MKEFDKIIGYEPVKKELKRICDILVNSEKYKKFGVKASQGLLIYGEPGVGKSLMADCFIKATKRKCFVCRKTKANGDFVDEITKTFEEAKNHAPSIILLDDMDKFANEDDRHTDTEEYVAVQSGIDNVKDSDVFVVATANDIYKLPYSLKRTGRFSKKIEIKPPEGKDAENIIKFYLSQKENVGNVNLTEITRLLNTKTCADLETIVNEAGVYAASEGKEEIEHSDMVRACMRVLYDAPEAEEEVLFSNSNERNRMTAYHEAGHVVVAEILEPESVTLSSIANYTGDAAGITSTYQTQEYFHSIKYMKNRVKVVLAGKAATELEYGEIDVGVSNDLQRAFKITARFIDDYCGFGFDSYVPIPNSVNTIDRCSDKIGFFINNYYNEVKEILAKNREFLEKIASKLLEKTTIMMSDIQEIKKTCNIVR